MPGARKKVTLRLDRNVVVTLDYDPSRLRANGTISFSSQPPDTEVMKAAAQTVEGVKYASDGLGDSHQELEITFTAYHAQTQERALAVLRAVLKRLGLTAVGGIRLENEASATNNGKKRKKR